MEYAELGASRGKTDFDSFQRNVQSSVAPYLGLPLSSLNVGKILVDATTIAARHQIRIPREWVLIFKAIYTLEGTCRKLDPNFNAMPLLENYVAPMLQPSYNWQQFSKDMILGSRDVQYIAQMLPRQLHWFFKRLAANGYAIETKDTDAEINRRQSEQNARVMAGAIFSSALVLAGTAFAYFYYEHGGSSTLAISVALFGAAGYLYRKN
jgi:ubiquinone biosynthesis protein